MRLRAGMPGKDFARRSPARGTPARQRPASRSGAGNRRGASGGTGFSAPSFSAGVIFGAALVLLASYAPTAFDGTVSAVRREMSPPTEEITFDFPDMLEKDTVVADPSAYPTEFPEDNPQAPHRTYMIQAASLRASGAAAALSAELRTAGLTASWERVDLSTGTWYRVMVGPFDSQVEANRALTLLRKRNLGAQLIKLS